jgi:hypothetical protein
LVVATSATMGDNEEKVSKSLCKCRAINEISDRLFPMNEHKRTSPDYILALIPDSRDMRRKLKLGKFTPPLGGKKIDCELCGQKVWIGLKQIAFKRSYPEALAVCIVCAHKHANED